MISIVVFSHPDKSCETRFSALEKNMWEVEVNKSLGFGINIRVESIRVINTEEMLMELMEAYNGSADAFIRNILGDDIADNLWKPYLAKRKEVSERS